MIDTKQTDSKRVMIFSGAGLSAESGLRTFRDNDGLWEEFDIMEVCSASGFAKDRQKVLDFYDKRRIQLGEVNPNAAHKMIARLKANYPQEVVVITQNVDDLLERAGCKDVIHLHGFLPEVRCELCETITNIGYQAMPKLICESCGEESLRHNIVMFSEYAPNYVLLARELERLSESENSLFVCIGTSGEVLNVAQFSQYAKKSVLNNLESSWFDGYFSICFIESAVSAAPKIERLVREFMQA